MSFASLLAEFPRRCYGMEKYCIFTGKVFLVQFIRKIADRNWGFGYLRPRTEKKVALSLAGKEISHYLPLVPRARLHHGTKIITQVPLIAGYIFLSLNEDERNELKRMDDNFVQIELQRVELMENVLIEELNALHQIELLAQTEKVLVNPGIQKGDKVVITQGHLKNLETEVIRRDDETDSIIINLTILNKNIEYPVSAERLKKITS